MKHRWNVRTWENIFWGVIIIQAGRRKKVECWSLLRKLHSVWRLSIRRENFSRKMASDVNETMDTRESDEESLDFTQLNTPLSQNPSKSPLDVSCAH